MPRSEKASIADMELADLTGFPTDEAILYEIREILRTADLMTVTKKKVKLELERRFNVNLDTKRAYISSGKCPPHSFSTAVVPNANDFQLPKLFSRDSYEMADFLSLITH